MAQSDADSRAKSLLEDRALVEACLAGDSAAWEALILKYQRSTAAHRRGVPCRLSQLIARRPLEHGTRWGSECALTAPHSK